MIDKKEAIKRLKKLCSKKECCINDIKNKLIEWGVGDNEVVEIIEILIQENYLNEERYANAFVHDKIKFEGWGKNKVFYELRRKGIDENIIEKAIDNFDDSEYYKKLKSLIEKKKSLLKEDTFENRQKILRYLYSKGYDIDDIKKFIDLDNYD